MTYLAGGLDALAEADERYRQCKALEPVLGPCTMPRPDPRDYGVAVPQSLPEIEVKAPFPWATVVLIAAALALFGGVVGRRRMDW